MRVHELNREDRPGGERHDQGAVAVIVAILMSVLLILAAFAVDIANAYANARQLSVAVDGAALSAAAKVGAAYPVGQACSPATLTSINATQIATTEANRVNSLNNRTGASEPVSSVTVSCANGNNAIDVRIANNRSVKTALAGIIGIDEMRPNSYATARFQRSPSGGGLRPWAICNSVVQEAAFNRTTTYWTGLDNQAVGVCGTTASGNWGGVDFNGGNNAAGDLAAWTLNGYPGPINIPDPFLPADPGVSGSSALSTAFTSIVGQIILLPSVSGFNTGGGNNASFNAVGAATVRICGIYYANNTYNIDTTSNLQSTCWRNPLPTITPGGSTIDTKFSTGSAVTTGNGANKVTTLTINDPYFDCTLAGSAIEVTVPGAKKQGSNAVNLVSTLETCTTNKVVTLLIPADNNVTNVTVTVKTTTTAPDVITPGFVPLGNGNMPIDHIQFVYEDYVGSFSGTGTGAPCALTRVDCAGNVQLWQ